MKSHRFPVADWLTDTDNPLDIDWSAVHSMRGRDCIDWLNGLPHTQCQLMLEPGIPRTRLTVEFYRDDLAHQWLTSHWQVEHDGEQPEIGA